MVNRGLVLVVLGIQLLAVCLFAYYFLTSLLGLRDYEVSWELFEVIEITSFIAMLIGLIFTNYILFSIQKRANRVEEQLEVAASSFHTLLLSKFAAWALTPSEQEIAMLIIKGFSIAEIAELRGTTEGAIKAHNSAIYAKSNLAGRVQFVSYFLEELTAKY